MTMHLVRPGSAEPLDPARLFEAPTGARRWAVFLGGGRQPSMWMTVTLSDDGGRRVLVAETALCSGAGEGGTVSTDVYDRALGLVERTVVVDHRVLVGRAVQRTRRAVRDGVLVSVDGTDGLKKSARVPPPVYSTACLEWVVPVLTAPVRFTTVDLEQTQPLVTDTLTLAPGGAYEAEVLGRAHTLTRWFVSDRNGEGVLALDAEGPALRELYARGVRVVQMVRADLVETPELDLHQRAMLDTARRAYGVFRGGAPTSDLEALVSWPEMRARTGLSKAEILANESSQPVVDADTLDGLFGTARAEHDGDRGFVELPAGIKTVRLYLVRKGGRWLLSRMPEVDDHIR
jgi:hypothetical protein